MFTYILFSKLSMHFNNLFYPLTIHGELHIASHPSSILHASKMKICKSQISCSQLFVGSTTLTEVVLNASANYFEMFNFQTQPAFPFIPVIIYVDYTYSTYSMCIRLYIGHIEPPFKIPPFSKRSTCCHFLRMKYNVLSHSSTISASHNSLYLIGKIKRWKERTVKALLSVKFYETFINFLLPILNVTIVVKTLISPTCTQRQFLTHRLNFNKLCRLIQGW